MNDDDRPWSELTEAEQNAVIAAEGEQPPGAVEAIEVARIVPEQWEPTEGDDDEDDYVEGVDASAGGEQA